MDSEAFKKYAPRWVKVIRWKKVRANMRNSFLFYSSMTLAAYLWYTTLDTNRYAWYLMMTRASTEEAREFLKRQKPNNLPRRNWEIDQYSTGSPPRYDMWERRRMYPEYYAGRYKDEGPRFGRAVHVSPTIVD